LGWRYQRKKKRRSEEESRILKFQITNPKLQTNSKSRDVKSQITKQKKVDQILACPLPDNNPVHPVHPVKFFLFSFGKKIGDAIEDINVNNHAGKRLRGELLVRLKK
jgi:hypothetical protein